jgi:chitodextrinase
MIALLLAVLLAAVACSGCQEKTPPPPPPTPAPVKGHLPEPAVTVPPAAAAEARDMCALLIFSNIEEGAAPLAVQFTAEGDCTSGTAKFTWDFGDGSPGATGETVVHTFEKAGTYKVKGRVTSDEIAGIEDVDEVEIIITAPTK